MRRITLLGTLLGVVMMQSGCIVVAGYTSRGGWFIWPGGLGLIVLLVLLYLFFGRRW